MLRKTMTLMLMIVFIALTLVGCRSGSSSSDLSGPTAAFTFNPASPTAGQTVTFTDESTGSPTSWSWTFGDGATSTLQNPTHVYSVAGSYTAYLTATNADSSNLVSHTITVSNAATSLMYPIVDTGQTIYYSDSVEITVPAEGADYYGQDAQISGNQPSYTVSSDGLTVYDNVTGLTWQSSPDTSGDGSITASDKLSWTNAQARPAVLNAAKYGGYSDWRLPTMKELYSLMNFNGTDPSGFSGTDTSSLTPFIDTTAFKFAYGDTSAFPPERIIDSQYASSNLYVSTASGSLLFGLNLADGRIKGYGLTLFGRDKTFFVQCVRGNTSYGVNNFVDNGDQTITDRATGLMWTKADSGTGMNWKDALAYAQTKNATNYLGHSDWRLPNAKELQSIVDYTRSPDTTSSAAINALFSCTAITNEKGVIDYPWYWSGTTHAFSDGTGAAGVYICFGRAMGYENSSWNDVHGAGCQRSDPKSGSLSDYGYAAYGYYNTSAPQGDAVRIYNYVRLVRDSQ